MKSCIKRFVFLIVDKFLAIHRSYLCEQIYQLYNIDRTVRFWELSVEGNVEIGEMTYLNDHCRIDSGKNSRVIIGKHCAIGRRVHITSKSHSLSNPTTSSDCAEIVHIESDTVVGNYVWIGDGVLVNKGVKIGDYAVIGANSVVVRDVQQFEIVGGVPAKHIRFNKDHINYRG
jgi:acetyltransferase-like isoleucine patch superfamily enzyme